MKAAFIEKPYSIEFIDAPEPSIAKPDDVKVKIAFTGICGSEVTAFHGQHPTRKPPIISGHESSGFVVEVGAAVTGFKPGDRVIIEPQYSCQTCPDCLRGNYNVCPEKAVLGTVKWSGSFAEYIIAPERTLIHLPDHVSLEEGALVEPLAVGAHAVRRSDIGLGSTVFIQGCGPIGIGLLVFARMAGATKIIMSDISDYNLEVARKIGADVLINSAQKDVKQAVMEETNGEGADFVAMAASNSKILNEAVECTRRFGQILEVAHFGTEPPFDARVYRWKELSMIGTYMYVRKDFEIALDCIAGGRLDVKPMISMIRPIEECVEAMTIADKRTRDFVKILLAF